MRHWPMSDWAPPSSAISMVHANTSNTTTAHFILQYYRASLVSLWFWISILQVLWWIYSVETLIIRFSCNVLLCVYLQMMFGCVMHDKWASDVQGWTVSTDFCYTFGVFCSNDFRIFELISELSNLFWTLLNDVNHSGHLSQFGW